ncbi:LuxR C-terminal-related transcriptional regulator [Actinotalea sp. C106]|uniref:LuxR C-terminal-related transcriptional regulator n=1 Tax=Actinotalea sp. C106 TaxID=2908644 RepID=UPI0020282A04|nr:LuxR C-terminal-related transcriptional regulator [Actinotalea sp. C106]
MPTQPQTEVRPTPRTDARLTERERVVLALLAEETTLEDIARSLYVSRNTVKSQVSSVYRKLGVASRAEAVARVPDVL